MIRTIRTRASQSAAVILAFLFLYLVALVTTVTSNRDSRRTLDLRRQDEIPFFEFKNGVLEVLGSDFYRGAVILINGNEQLTRQSLFAPQTRSFLTSRKAAKKIARGESVLVQVRNANGLVSLPVRYTRPVA